MAHLITLGAFFFFILVRLGIPLVAAIFLVLGFGGLMGLVLDISSLSQTTRGPVALITSLGFYTFIENFMKMVVSPQPYAFKAPSYLTTIFRTSFLTFRTIDLFIIGASIAIMWCFHLFIKKN